VTECPNLLIRYCALKSTTAHQPQHPLINPPTPSHHHTELNTPSPRIPSSLPPNPLTSSHQHYKSSPHCHHYDTLSHSDCYNDSYLQHTIPSQPKVLKRNEADGGREQTVCVGVVVAVAIGVIAAGGGRVVAAAVVVSLWGVCQSVSGEGKVRG